MKEMHLFYAPEGRLRLTLGNQSYIEVVLAWASPLTYPGKYLSFLDGKGKEIFMVTDPVAELAPEVWSVARGELQRRYLNGVVHKVLSTKTEFGSTYWHVITDRGEKEFITQSLQENAQWLSPDYLLIIDVDGNRFEIPSISGLDEKSKQILSVTV
ncbi:MAG: DUF1854 domain-containing protein [Fimbriimonadaceae bacterium]|nr:DUF1854 domain-containing protein [Fimbriimonadaceae bacterium]